MKSRNNPRRKKLLTRRDVLLRTLAVVKTRRFVGRSTLLHADKRDKLRCCAERRAAA